MGRTVILHMQRPREDTLDHIYAYKWRSWRDSNTLPLAPQRSAGFTDHDGPEASQSVSGVESEIFTNFCIERSSLGGLICLP